MQIYSTIIGQADSPIAALDFLASADAGGNLEVVGANNLIRRQNDYQSITVSSDNPLLGTLANNGGPTLTHELMAGSPAIGQGSNLLSLSNDQRGNSYSRVVGGATDIGAFEVQSVAGPALPGDYNSDQVVDAADYVLWRKTMGEAVTQYMGADGNGNSMIDPGDYGVWRGNFGASSDGAGASSSLSAANAITAESDALAVTDAEFSFDRELMSASSDSELMAAFADYSNAFARAVGRTSSLVDGERIAPFADFPTQDVRTRDKALLAIFREHSLGPDSQGAVATWKDGFQRDAAHPTSRGLHSPDDALNQALLQTATFGAASSGRA